MVAVKRQVVRRVSIHRVAANVFLRVNDARPTVLAPAEGVIAVECVADGTKIDGVKSWQICAAIGEYELVSVGRALSSHEAIGNAVGKERDVGFDLDDVEVRVAGRGLRLHAVPVVRIK